MSGNKGKKYCVIHGHFYQPPRESPWFGEIQRQDSARPYHNWNERIYDECYRTNAFSRILNDSGEIVGVNNNYSYMSFNFGPTLFRWLYRNKPLVYQRIVEADRRSCERFNGHGSAVAQAYNHTILPHASYRDTVTQIRWAKSFFKRHFGRMPEGMWLAETGINNQTVEVLIKENIRFVILSPNQAEAFRERISTKSMETSWESVDEKGLDPRYPYRLYAYDKRGRRKKGFISVFFFDEPVSRAISFENLLDNADILTGRLSSCLDEAPEENQLVNIATDGETFGHHKKHSDMCLAYFFRKKAEEAGLQVVNYAYYLSINPPTREVKLRNFRGEGTAWSCAHGTGRWIRDCGCSTGGQPGWNQAWRGPFREALDYLNIETEIEFTREFEKYFKNPDMIRNRYEPFIEDKSGVDAFLQKHAEKPLSPAVLNRLVMLLESQVYMQYAYTSCAWFFSDITGIETIQNIRYALRAWQLCWPRDTENTVLQQLLSMLHEAKSNIHGHTGATILHEEAGRMISHMERAAFTAALNTFIYDNKTNYTMAAYHVEITELHAEEVGDKRWQVFSAKVAHRSSREKLSMVLALTNKGKGDIRCRIFDDVPDSIAQKLRSSQGLETLFEEPVSREFSLNDAFKPYCEALTDQLITDFANETLLNYISWADNGNNRLDIITALNNGLPESLSGIVSFFLDEEWDLGINQLVNQNFTEDIRNSLDDVYKKSRYYDVSLDMRNSADRFDDAIIDAISGLNITEACTEKMAWLEDMITAVERYDIPIRKMQIQDYFYLFYKQVRLRIQECKEKEESLSREEKGCIERVNAFAEKIGFCSKQCQI
ncbi:DUF3536 domain-containing protein [Chitinivibrio alkaliphilus]|uniref:Glycoside hydrolase family 57 n=1 Tax=Chitinivibrio alkaliphilus ACht1 TaxID=1313304 RepID=U7D869_9BACT|nr:DUF3536 domain-containing protein [Chitinivibrio alkaliphilus]ERP31277.1 glycoside hydrolase family 57 [Chitinivibrio alkaliphilus ACht1]